MYIIENNHSESEKEEYSILNSRLDQYVYHYKQRLEKRRREFRLSVCDGALDDEEKGPEYAKWQSRYEHFRPLLLQRSIDRTNRYAPEGHRCHITYLTILRIMKEILDGRLKNYTHKGGKFKILCIIGESGVGKTLASLHLKNKCGANVVCSFTNRKPRETEVEGREHHFVDIIPYHDEILALSVFAGKTYYALKSQVFGECTVYVIDEAGLLDLIKRNGDAYDITTVYIKRDCNLRRMRGVSAERIGRDKNRVKLDLSFFNHVIINNGTKAKLFKDIEQIYFDLINRK